MTSRYGHIVAAATLIAGVCAWSLPSRAQGYYIDPNAYSNMYAVNAAQLAQNLQFGARVDEWWPGSTMPSARSSTMCCCCKAA